MAPGRTQSQQVLVIDGTHVLADSYNWTAKAESNSENLLVIDYAELAKKL